MRGTDNDEGMDDEVIIQFLHLMRPWRPASFGGTGS
jgi:hypothetical protein